MSDRLPDTRLKWEKAAKGKNIDQTQPLAVGTAFVSGSKFQFQHFIRLRVLYKQEEDPKQLVAYSWFPSGSLEEMTKLLKGEPDTLYLRELLKKSENIGSDWDVEKAKKSGTFAVAMELLHLIASREVPVMEVNEDKTDSKVEISPAKASNMIQSGARYGLLSHPILHTPTPRPKFQASYYESPLSDLDMSQLSMALSDDQHSQDSDFRQAEDEYERSDFSPGDEQTVNAALVALIMALSWLLKSTGCVHHDRASFSIPSGDDSDLYKASVDGLILHLGKGKCNAFMEVKRNFRGENQAVRRQIAAQMAAFIFQQDIKLAEQGTMEQQVKKTEKANKGKAKQAEGVEDQIFRKWMVSLDGYWAHINIASYDRQYLDYLSGTKFATRNDAFMEMVEYGAFDLRRWSGKGLGLFLELVGALMLGTLG